MKSQSMLLAALASAPVALAHTVFTDFLVNGMPQGDGVAIRMSNDPPTAGSPINGLSSEDMACNVGGTKGVGRVASVPDGATLSFEIREWANDPSKGRLDRGHYGPCAVYLKKVASAIKDEGKGDGWFKIFDRGYDESSETWCTDKIIDNNGLLNVVLPEGLEGGAYLARPEILALHNANKGDPQFYTGCAQIHLDSTGNLGPESTVSIPGHVQLDTPSTNFNIYNNDLSKYEVPGPPVAKLVAKSESASTSSSSQTEGLKPEGCLVENANWCGVEVPSYSSESGCWASAEDCWSQGETCWSSAPPTGGAGCELWQKKCEGIQAACKSGNFNGPPKDFGKTPAKNQVDVGEIMAVNGGGVVDKPAAPKPTTSKPEAVAKPTSAPAPVPDEEKEEEQPQEDGEEQNEAPAPAPAPAKPTSDAAPAPAPQQPKPSPSNSYNALPVPDKNDNTDEEQDTNPTTTSPPSAPKPTKGPACVPGYKCVTVTEIATLTQTVYVTQAAEAAGGYKRNVRKHLHAHKHRF